MWPVHALESLPLDSLRGRGRELAAAQIYDPAGGSIADAVVQRGATGSFVSPEVLIITNRHVAYGGPDGRPSDFAKESVPYRPKVRLPISSARATGGYLTITIVSPGRTSRYVSSFELEKEIGFYLPYVIQGEVQQITIIDGIEPRDPAIAQPIWTPGRPVTSPMATPGDRP